jgi:hypothetical protein
LTAFFNILFFNEIPCCALSNCRVRQSADATSKVEVQALFFTERASMHNLHHNMIYGFQLANSEDLGVAVEKVWSGDPLDETDQGSLAEWLAAYGECVVYDVPWDDDLMGAPKLLVEPHYAPLILAMGQAWLRNVERFLSPEIDTSRNDHRDTLAGIAFDMTVYQGFADRDFKEHGDRLAWCEEQDAWSEAALEFHRKLAYAGAAMQFVHDSVPPDSSDRAALQTLATELRTAVERVGEAMHQYAPESRAESAAADRWMHRGVIFQLNLEWFIENWGASHIRYRPWWMSSQVLADWRKLAPYSIKVTGIGWGMLPPNQERLDGDQS